MRRVMVIGCGGSGKSPLARSPKKPRIVSAIEQFGAYLRLIQLFRDRDGESLLATVGPP
jgi:hypothetical protein